jgi:hypothetical protein
MCFCELVIPAWNPASSKWVPFMCLGLKGGRKMSIMVTCPKGHKLKVKDSMAGKTGLCPLCAGQVYVYVPVPVPVKESLSEEVILDFIGPSQPSPSSAGMSGIDLEDAKPQRIDKAHHETPWKSCAKCNKDIPSQTHICPYCHTYLADIAGY